MEIRLIVRVDALSTIPKGEFDTACLYKLPSACSVPPPVPERAAGLGRHFDYALRKDNLPLHTTEPGYRLIPSNMPNENERFRVPYSTCRSLPSRVPP